MTTSTPQTNKTRSPNYPAISLKEAVDRLRVIYETQRRYPATRELLATLMGYKSLNGASATMVSALAKYGLIEGHGDNLRVSEMGQDLILHRKGDPEYTTALRTSAFMPTFFRELRDEYPYGLPGEHAIRATLIKRGFNPKAIDGAIRSYRDTMDFVDAEVGVPSSESLADSLPEAAMQTQAGTYKPEPDFSPAPPTDPLMKSIQLPLSISEWATLQAAFPITEAAWKQMIAVLNAMKPALVAPNNGPSPGSLEDLLATSRTRGAPEETENRGDE